MLRLDILVSSPVLQNQRRFWRIELGILHHNSPYTRSLWNPFLLDTACQIFYRTHEIFPPDSLLIKSSVQPSSNNKVYTKKIWIFSDRFFPIFSSRVQLTDLTDSRRVSVLCRATGTELHPVFFFENVSKKPQLPLRRAVSQCFCHPLASSLICWDCKQGLAALKRINSVAWQLTQKGESCLLWLYPSKGIILYYMSVFTSLFLAKPHRGGRSTTPYP